MSKRFWVLGLLLLAFAPAAHADLGFWSAALIGKWRHPTNGDTYQFRRDSTYIFRAGAKRSAGNLSHAGFWKIVQPTQQESGGSLEGPVVLSLKSTSRVVLEGQKPRVLRSNRRFRIVVDIARRVKTDADSIDTNRYWIGDTRWKRVR